MRQYCETVSQSCVQFESGWVAVQRRLREEVVRRRECLAECTEAPLQEAVEAELVAAHLADLLHHGFPALLSARRLDDLARLYRCPRPPLPPPHSPARWFT